MRDRFSRKRATRRSYTSVLNSKEGVALIATLILGMIAISFTLTMLYLAREGSRMSGIEGRYQEALQAAKGGAEIMIDYIRQFDDDHPVTSTSDLPPSTQNLCSSMTYPSGNCTDSSGIHYYPDTGTSCLAYVGNYTVSIRITDSECAAQGSVSSQQCVCFHSITAQAINNQNHNEKATVQVLYKVSYQ